MTTHLFAIAAATVAAFIASGVWYAAFGAVLGRLHPAYADAGPMRPATILVELLRSAVLATVLSLAGDRLEIGTAGEALLVAVIAWVGFPVVLLSGSVLHERVPWRLAAIHAGDWLIKLVAVTLIVGLWS